MYITERFIPPEDSDDEKKKMAVSIPAFHGAGFLVAHFLRDNTRYDRAPCNWCDNNHVHIVRQHPDSHVGTPPAGGVQSAQHHL